MGGGVLEVKTFQSPPFFVWLIWKLLFNKGRYSLTTSITNW